MTSRSATLLLFLGAACSTRALVRPGAAPAGDTLVMRAPIRAGVADAVFDRALRVLQAQGYRLSRCDEGLSALETERLEFDATCGRTTCLSRQIVHLKVGWRAVRVDVRREFWDAAFKGWAAYGDRRSVEAIRREEADLLAELMKADFQSPLRFWKPPGSPGACAPIAPCGSGTCLSAL